ncbi:MAG TPA: alpha/beta hydrolase [Steroidobacteraceae bacterium]|jgi:pimeloyl-ACP methyl ester carboxylesterase|nr:alpha/beta hydrolase [Steroidobacteraceae bacterium]
MKASASSATEREHRLRLADGRTLACLELGDPAGPPVLYFHGYPGSRLEARVAATAAEKLGLRLLSVDRPGFGQSTFQRGRRIGGWAADIGALADQLALDRFSIVGVSGGAPYAMACAASLPDRLARIALVCPLGPLEVAASKAGMLAQDRLMLALGAHAAPLARGVVHLLAHWMRQDAERYVKFMIAGMVSPDRDLFADPGYRSLVRESTAEALRQGGRGAAWELTLIARRWDFRLQDVRMPVSLWQGLADQILPAAMARRLAAALPACTARYFPGEGHLSLVVRHIGEVLAELRP